MSEANNQLFISKQISAPILHQQKMFEIHQVQSAAQQSQQSKRSQAIGQAEQQPAIQEAVTDSEGMGSSYQSSLQSPGKASKHHE